MFPLRWLHYNYTTVCLRLHAARVRVRACVIKNPRAYVVAIYTCRSLPSRESRSLCFLAFACFLVSGFEFDLGFGLSLCLELGLDFDFDFGLSARFDFSLAFSLDFSSL